MLGGVQTKQKKNGGYAPGPGFTVINFVLWTFTQRRSPFRVQYAKIWIYPSNLGTDLYRDLVTMFRTESRFFWQKNGPTVVIYYSQRRLFSLPKLVKRRCDYRPFISNTTDPSPKHNVSSSSVKYCNLCRYWMWSKRDRMSVLSSIFLLRVEIREFSTEWAEDTAEKLIWLSWKR